MKGLKAFQKMCGEDKEIDIWQEHADIVEKELKALEIIKEKKVNVELLHITRSSEEYNNEIMPYGNLPLIQEEFDLLKEIFKDGKI